MVSFLHGKRLTVGVLQDSVPGPVFNIIMTWKGGGERGASSEVAKVTDYTFI